MRREIGLVFQDSALDRTLTVAENLRFAGLLRNLPTAVIRQRSDELLELFNLRDRRDKPVATLSGGMRRALIWRVACCTARVCYFWMSPPWGWMYQAVVASGVSSSAYGVSKGSPSFSPHTISKKPRRAIR